MKKYEFEFSEDLNGFITMYCENIKDAEASGRILMKKYNFSKLKIKLYRPRIIDTNEEVLTIFNTTK